MINYDKLASLINDYQRTKQLPNIQFDKDVSLRSVTTALVVASGVDNDADINDPTVINTIIKELEIANRDMATNGNIFTEFQNTADAFAQKLNNSLLELKSIKKEVSSLMAQTVQAKQNLLAADLEVSTLKDIQSNDVGFSPLDWTGIDLVGSERAIVIKQHAALNMDEHRVIGNDTIGMLMARLPFQGEGTEVALQNAEIPEDVIPKILEKIKDIATVDYGQAYIYMVRDICNPKDNRFKEMNNYLKVVLQEGEGIPRLLREMKIMAVTASVLSSGDFGLSASSLEILEDNIKLYNQYILLYAYIAIYFRRDVYAKAILVGATLYNPDNFEEFVALGGDLQKLAIYYTYYHKNEDGNDTKVPYVGVSIKYVMENVEKAEAEVSANAANLAASVDDKTKHAERQAFVIVATKYLADKESGWFSTRYTTSDHATHALGIYNGSPTGTPIEDMLYELYFNSAQTMWLTRDLYYKLGSAYMKHIANSEEYTAETGDVVDLAVFASIISKFVVENLFAQEDKL